MDTANTLTFPTVGTTEMYQAFARRFAERRARTPTIVYDKDNVLKVAKGMPATKRRKSPHPKNASDHWKRDQAMIDYAKRQGLH